MIFEINEISNKENMSWLNEAADQLDEVYNGSPWYGRSVRDILQKIHPQKAGLRLHGEGHSIFELAEHMLSWRNYLIEKLNGNHAFIIEVNDQRDWKPQRPVSENDWQNLLDAFDKSQSSLLAKLRNAKENELAGMVPGKSYTFRPLIEGIIQHDIYHAGQLVTTAKSLGAFEG